MSIPLTKVIHLNNKKDRVNIEKIKVITEKVFRSSTDVISMFQMAMNFTSSNHAWFKLASDLSIALTYISTGLGIGVSAFEIEDMVDKKQDNKDFTKISLLIIGSIIQITTICISKDHPTIIPLLAFNCAIKMVPDLNDLFGFIIQLRKKNYDNVTKTKLIHELVDKTFDLLLSCLTISFIFASLSTVSFSVVTALSSIMFATLALKLIWSYFPILKSLLNKEHNGSEAELVNSSDLNANKIKKFGFLGNMVITESENEVEEEVALNLVLQ